MPTPFAQQYANRLTQQYADRRSASLASPAVAPIQSPAPPVYAQGSTAGSFSTRPIVFNTKLWNEAVKNSPNPWAARVAMAQGQEATAGQNWVAAQEAQRANAILGGYQQRYSTGMETLAGLSNQEQIDLQRQYANLQSRGLQDLTSRGLTGTTLTPLMAQGYQRQYGQASNRLNDTLTREKMDYQTRLSGDVLNFMERPTQNYPYLQELAGLASQLGQMGGGGESASAAPQQGASLYYAGTRSYPGGIGYDNSSRLYNRGGFVGTGPSDYYATRW